MKKIREEGIKRSSEVVFKNYTLLTKQFRSKALVTIRYYQDVILVLDNTIDNILITEYIGKLIIRTDLPLGYTTMSYIMEHRMIGVNVKFRLLKREFIKRIIKKIWCIKE